MEPAICGAFYERKEGMKKMYDRDRQLIVAGLLITVLCVLNISAMRQLLQQDTSVFSTVARLRIPLTTTTDKAQSVPVRLMSTRSPAENAHGLAQIRTMGAFIIVTLSLSGLAPNTTYEASLQTGDCASQGPVVFPLQPLLADMQGDAMTITTLNVHTLTTTHISINVHKADPTATIKRLQALSSIACGDVKTP